MNRSSQQRRKRRRDEDSPAMEDYWMKELSVTMKANQTLLEKLLEEKSQLSTDRDPFIQYVSQLLRTSPQEQYEALTHAILGVAHQKDRRASTSFARPGCSGTHPSQQAYIPQQQQQQYYQNQNWQDNSSNWQHGGYHELQPVRTPRRGRESLDSLGRMLAANMGDEWNSTPATGNIETPSTDTE